MDEVWERAVEAALDGQKDLSSARSLTLDGAVKCAHGRLPPPSLLEKFEQLKQLSIANVGVSSLADFPRLPHLQKLILSDNRIAGGLEFLVEAGLGSLRDLDLSNNKIQYIDDLAPLAQLKLVSLDLYECPVTRIVDYRAKVFGMIRSLKYLDKADAEDNERPESDEEEDDDEDEEDDGGSGEIDGEERCGKLDAGPPDEEEDEDEEADESEEDEEEGTGFLGANIPYPNNTHARSNARSNGFGHGSVFDSLGHEGDEDSSSEDEEDVEDEDDGEAERFLRLAVDASRGFQSATLNGQVNVESSSDDEEIDDDEDEEEEDVENVEVHEVEESEDEDEDDEDEEDDDGDEGEEEEDVEEDEDEDNKQPSSGPLPINAAIVPGGEIDDHESDDEDENGELGEEDDYVGDEEVEYDEEDVEEEEEEEDNGQEYLVQPVPAYLPSHVPAPVPVGPAEDEEEASDFEVGLDDEDEDEDDDDDDVEEEDDDDHEQKQILSSKRKRDQDDDTDDSDDEDDEDERPPNKKR